MSFAYVNPAGIQRLEVLKGAQSGLYGSRAVGGVINVITSQPTKTTKAHVAATTGSFHTNAIDGSISGPLDESLGYAVDVSGMTSEGFSAQTDRDGGGDQNGYEPDGLQRWSANGKLAWQATKELQVHAGVLRMHTAQEIDGWKAPDAAFDHAFTDIARVSGGAGYVLGRMEVHADLAQTSTSRISRLGGVGDLTYEGSERWSQMRLAYRATETLVLSAGAERTVEDGSQNDESDPELWAETVTRDGTFASATWSARRAELSLAGRLDRHSDFGNHASGRVAGAVFLPEALGKVRAAVGNGFRAPSIYELHGIDVGLIGNPDLQPERSISYEVGTDLRPMEGMQVSLTGFRSRFHDKIEFTDADWSNWPIVIPGTYVNGEQVSQVTGVESQARLTDIAKLGLDLDGWYTWMNSTDGAGNKLHYTPVHSGGARAIARQDAKPCLVWESLGFRSATGARASTGDITAGYTVCDAAVGATFRQRWDASLRVENLLQERYEVTPGYTTAPMAWYLTLGATF
jgi:vitamin B12 transporter